jgi:putative transposase
MPYWNCLYHLVWATKGRQAVIDEVIEPLILANVQRVLDEQKCHLIAVNCVTDHMHVACAIPPSLSVARVVSQIKGAISHDINSTLERESKFQWQDSYGVLTFGQQALEFVRQYVQNQKQHHQSGKLFNALERTTE